MKKAALITAILLIAIGLQSFAQATFTVNAPTRVAVGDKFAVTYRLRNGEGTGLKVPQINGCTQIYGPAVSSSMSYSVVNGKASSSSVYDYTYTYRAEKEGQFKIPEATIVVDGKHLTTRPMTLTIVPSTHSSTRGSSSSQSSQADVSVDDIATQSADKPVSDNDVFVRIIMSKNTAYEQEAVECTIKLYTKYSISEFFPTKQPSFDGFLIQELDVRPALNQVEVYNGQRYMTALLKKCIMYPQKAGKLTINSGNYDINVVQYDNVNMGLFTVQNPRERKIKVSSNSVSINIKPLPTPQPEGFTGAVGKFTASSHLVGNSFKTNEPATLIYDITGTGNVKYLKDPELDFPSEFECYAPKRDEKVRVDGNNMTGTIEIEYTFVPQSVGDFKIGADKFVYFDPSEERYNTISLPAFDIKVLKGANSGKAVARQDVNQKNRDILNIVTGEKDTSKHHDFLIGNWLYWIVLATLLVVFTAGVAVNRNRIRRAADVLGTRRAKASKVARRRLKAARAFMKAGESDKFYEEELHATWGYLSDKLAIPVSQLSRDNIQANLLNAGADEEITNRTIRLIDDCEMARYAPSSSKTHLQEVYDQTVDIIDELEKINRK